MNNRDKNIKKLVLTAVFVALGMVLPFATGQIKEIGDSLLPMHLVVMLCGAICGCKYGLVAGAILPMLRSLCFGMPPLYPNSIWMTLELATYGFVIGFLYSRFKEKHFWNILFSLVIAMIAGRVVWGISKAVILGLSGKPFSFQMFIAGGILDAIPGIILQLILVPAIIHIIGKAKE